MNSLCSLPDSGVELDKWIPCVHYLILVCSLISEFPVFTAWFLVCSLISEFPVCSFMDSQCSQPSLIDGLPVCSWICRFPAFSSQLPGWIFLCSQLSMVSRFYVFSTKLHWWISCVHGKAWWVDFMCSLPSSLVDSWCAALWADSLCSQLSLMEKFPMYSWINT